MRRFNPHPKLSDADWLRNIITTGWRDQDRERMRMIIERLDRLDSGGEAIFEGMGTEPEPCEVMGTHFTGQGDERLVIRVAGDSCLRIVHPSRVTEPLKASIKED